MESNQETERLRAMADKLDCFTEEDFLLLANVKPGTGEAWRKRGTGPAYIRLGNRVLYPRKFAVKFIESRVREPRQIDVKAVL